MPFADFLVAATLPLLNEERLINSEQAHFSDDSDALTPRTFRQFLLGDDDSPYRRYVAWRRIVVLILGALAVMDLPVAYIGLLVAAAAGLFTARGLFNARGLKLAALTPLGGAVWLGIFWLVSLAVG